MNLRYLVPALGIIALTATSVRAEDKAPVVTFKGWVDTTLTFSDDNSADDTSTAKDEKGATVRFSAAAALKATWNVNESMVARTNIWFYPDRSTGGDVTVDTGTGEGGNDVDNANVQVREAVVTYALNNTFSLQMGKYIDHLGWIAADPFGLLTVNGSLIGYTSAYGNDVLGAALIVAPNGGNDFTATLHITNGYFTGSDAINGGPSDNRENTDLGFGVGATWYFMHDEKGKGTSNIDFDFAYDMHSDQGGSGINSGGPGTTAGMGGDVLMAGLNATLNANSKLTFGAEIISLQFNESEQVDGTGNKDGSDRLQGLFMVNYKIKEEGTPMSVTVMAQYVEISPDGLSAFDGLGFRTEKRTEIAAALLTNPLGSDKFGLNLEIAYYSIDDRYNSDVDEYEGVKALSVALEAIAFF